MARHKHTTTIEGLEFAVIEFPATEGLRLLTTLTKLLAGPVAAALEALPPGGLARLLDQEMNFSLVGKAVGALSDRLDEDQVDELVKRLLACTYLDGKEVRPQFDVLFQGRYTTLFKLVWYVLRVNFEVPLADWLAAASMESDEGGEPEKGNR